MPQAQAQARPQLSQPMFLRKTKAKRLPLQIRGPGFVEGGVTSFQLPQSGLANELWLYLRVPVVVAGTVTGGKWAGSNQSTAGALAVSAPISYNPAPLAIVKRMQLYNNANYLLRDLSGFSWYSWVTDRYCADPMSSDQASYFRYDTQLNIYGATNRTNPIKPGADIVAGTYYLEIALPNPVSFNHAGDRGLLVLSTENVFYYFDLTWGTIATGITATGGSSDLIKGLTGTGLTVTVGTPDLQATMDYFMIPQGEGGALEAQTSMYMAVIENVQSITQTGRQTFLIPPNDYYTSVGLHNWGNGAPIPSDMITNISWIYGGQITDVQENLRIQQVRQAWLTGQAAMDGKILFDNSMRMGLTQKRDDYDAFNAQSITGLQVNWEIGAAQNITNGQVTAILESLRPFKQSG